MKTNHTENLKKIFHHDIIVNLILSNFFSALYIFGFKMNYIDSVKTIGVLFLFPLISMITYKVLENMNKEEFIKIKIYTFISSFFLWFIPSIYSNYIDRDKTMSFQRIIALIIFSLIFSTIITKIYILTRKRWNVKIKE